MAVPRKIRMAGVTHHAVFGEAAEALRPTFNDYG